jgi:hypothetical protein
MPQLRALSVYLALGVGLLFMAGASCDDPPTITDSGTGGGLCVIDGDCPAGEACRNGECTPTLWGGDDAGVIGDGDGDGDGDADAGLVDAGPDPAGILAAQPSNFIEFGAQALGSPVERQVTLANIGDAPLTVLQVVLDENDSGEFQAAPTGAIGQELQPGEGLNILVTHTPIDGVPDTSILRVVHTADTDGFYEIELFAEFKGQAEISVTGDLAELTPNVETLDLGSVPVESSFSQTIYVRNRGSGDSVLTLNDIKVFPTGAGFSLDHAAVASGILGKFIETCITLDECPDAADACTDGVCHDADGAPLNTFPIEITFTPTDAGPHNATLTVGHDADGAGAETAIELIGTGATGELVTAPSAVVFNDAFVGLTAIQSLTIQNVGAAPLPLEGFTISGVNPPFAVVHGLTLPHTLYPQESVVVDVTFTPVVEGEATRVLTLETGEDDPPLVDLYGLSREPASLIVLDDGLTELLDGDPVTFGDRYVGTLTPLVIRLANLGPGDLTITRMALEGPGAPRYSFSPTDFANALPPVFDLNTYSPNAVLTLNYAPNTITGVEDLATLVIETDDPAQPRFELDLSGRAIRPVIEVSPMAIDFGPMTVGGPDGEATITVRNTGYGPLVVTDIVPPNDTQFVVTPSMALPATVNFGGPDLLLDVVFTPSNTSYSAETLLIHSNDLADDEVTVVIGGGGATCPPRANASVMVDPGDGSCIYTCNSGYHECGTSCLSNSSPDSCGSSCTPCDSRPAASRGCVAGTGECTYSCTGSNHDLNDDLEVAQGSFSNGCEYACAVSTPTAETCNRLDDDCDGTPDDGLPLENPEPQASCSGSVVNLGNVEDNNQPVTYTDYMIYPDLDQDWFRVRVVEDEFNFCIGGEDYRSTVELLDIPDNRDYDLQVRFDSCTGTSFTSAGVTTSETIVIDWGGSCGSDDNRWLYIRVYPYPSSTGPGSCEPYRLRVTNDRR